MVTVVYLTPGMLVDNEMKVEVGEEGILMSAPPKAYAFRLPGQQGKVFLRGTIVKIDAVSELGMPEGMLTRVIANMRARHIDDLVYYTIDEGSYTALFEPGDLML
jgi:hypothetical protein